MHKQNLSKILVIFFVFCNIIFLLRHWGNFSKHEIETSFKRKDTITADKLIIPVIIFTAIDSSISQSIKYVKKYNPSRELFPVIVSVDGHNDDLDKAIEANRDDFDQLWRDFQSNSQLGYSRISEHYKWALDKIFSDYEIVIILEDDLIISCDFFDYFSRMVEILHNDPTVWCISAWNDNGNSKTIQKRPDVLRRTDFMPGLGWMMTKNTWLEIRENWPQSYWDDYMRSPGVRKGRQCIYPDVSRTKHMNIIRTSNGQFMNKYSLNHFNENCLINWKGTDISYLYDAEYSKNFYSDLKSAVFVNFESFQEVNLSSLKRIKIKYSESTFATIASYFGLMDDDKFGVYRCSYNRVVLFYYRNVYVYLVPE